MATYKLEIKKEFGQLHHRLWNAASGAPDFGAAATDLDGLLEKVDADVGKLQLGTQDTVIFRQIDYDSAGALREAVRTAVY